MPTIIDALIVTLGLDPTGFKAGEKDTEASVKKTKEAASKNTKEMEAKARAAGQVFDKVRNQVLALAATFTAGVGLKNFLAEMTTADASAGRTAHNIGVTTETLTAWQAVAERAGGTATGMTGSMQGLTQQFQQLQLTGQSGVVPYFRAIGVEIATAEGKMRPMSAILLDLSDKMSKMDPARAQALGKGLGLDEGTVNVLLQGRKAIQGLLVEQEKLGRASKADADAAAVRQKEFNALGQASADLGRKLLTTLTPALLVVVKALTALAEWFSRHPYVFGAFATAVGLAAAALTVALTILSFQGFMGLVAAMFAVPAAATAAAAGIGTAAAATTAATATIGTGLLGLLGILAKSALLVAAAGAVGYAAGTALFNAFIENTPFSDWIGKKIAQITALFGDQNAKDALDSEERARRAARGPVQPQPAIAAGPMPQGTGQRDALGRLKRTPNTGAEGSWEPSSRTVTVIAAAADREQRDSSARTAPTATARALAVKDIQRFMEMGWSREQAAGLAANVQSESGGDEKAVGDNGRAYGLAQWHPDRQKEFAKQFGKDIREASRDEQLQFINYELRQGNERAAGDALSATRTPEQAAAIVSQRYERPKDVTGEAAKRAQLAVSLYKPAPDPALRTGAATAVAGAQTTNSTQSSTSHTETHIGNVNVNLPNATDAQSVAQGLGPELKKNMSFAAQANYGLVN